ncbi:hypothetical protein DM02DRAFT_619041 [Periconia macrospinosa]|uniref:F-box domain-containing protein n=1 Tax=Periconia macrospinosa TaxID=97972 RepID=A0A2V1D8G8_9PLEO|nr:hypothetical protein DM02DRAFT_619041 [Periconia macrospinosa]
MPGIRFTDLPAEVRNAVYGFCTPLTGYMEDFRGLLLASKQVRTEYEHEAINTMTLLFNRTRSEWPHELELRIQNPTKISEVNNIDVRLPASLYDPFLHDHDKQPDDYVPPSQLDPCLSFLFSLHVSQLTIGYYTNEGYKTPHSILTSRLVPHGLLTDLSTILTPHQQEKDEPAAPPPPHAFRRFRLQGPLRIRRLRYQWAYPDDTSSTFRVFVERANTQFFLSESKWWQLEDTPFAVRNWGSSSHDTVFFDINVW